MPKRTMIQPGMVIGTVRVVDRHPMPDQTHVFWNCVCECGRPFTRRSTELQRAVTREYTATCGKGDCRKTSYVERAKKRPPGQRRRHLVNNSSDPPLTPIKTCHVCGNQPWVRTPDRWNEGSNCLKHFVCGPDGKCVGCQGVYAPEPSNDRSVLGSSAALLLDVG